MVLFWHHNLASKYQIWVSNPDRGQIAQWTFTRTAKASASKSAAVREILPKPKPGVERFSGGRIRRWRVFQWQNLALEGFPAAKPGAGWFSRAKTYHLEASGATFCFVVGALGSIWDQVWPLGSQGWICDPQREVKSHFCPSGGVPFGSQNHQFGGLGAFVETWISRETELNSGGLRPPRSLAGGGPFLDHASR